MSDEYQRHFRRSLWFGFRFMALIYVMLELLNRVYRPGGWTLFFDLRTILSALLVGLLATAGRFVREVQKERET